MPANHSMMKLGKKPPRHDARTLQLAKYIKAHLPAPPPVVDWSSKVSSWPMYMNDTIGDCAIAAPGHMIEAWTANGQGNLVVLADADVLSAYEAVSGYNPADPSTDSGCVELDVLKYWQKTGIGGRTIGPYTAFSPRSSIYTKDAVFLGVGAYIGLSLPVTAQNQDTWDVVPGYLSNPDAQPGSWGGHAVDIVGYDARTLTIVTWGALKQMTWSFFKLYCDEGYAIFSKDFVNAQGVAPNGFDTVSLQADLAALH